MMDESRREVFIDADFFNKVTEKEQTGELFKSIMKEMDVSPVMHQYVLEEELLGNPVAKKLVEEKTIKIYSYSDFISELNRQEYEEIFKSSYLIFNGEEFPTGQDVYKFRRSKCSLGEIRSTLMAWYMKIDMFMSDDGQAKHFVESKLNSRRRHIDVYNIFDTLKEIGQKGDRVIVWNDIKATANYAFQNRSKKYEEITKIWRD